MTADAVSRAATFVDARRFDDALDTIGAHLASRPDDGRALCVSTQALIGAGRSRDAQTTARQAVQLLPHDDWPLRLLASAYANTGQSDEAIDAADRALALAPSSWRCHLQVAQVRLLTGRVTPRALAAAEKARELAPNVAITHRVAGMVHAASNERRQARECLHRALALDPGDAVARHELARLQLKRGQLAAAADGFAAAVRLDPRLQVGTTNLDVVANNLLNRLGIVIVVAAFVAAGVRGVAVPAVVTALIVGVGWSFRRKTGGRLNRYLRAFPSRAPLLTVAAGLVTLALIALWVEALGPMIPCGPLGMLVTALCCFAATQCRRSWMTARGRRPPRG